MIEHLMNADSDTNVHLEPGDELAVMINNLGGMTQMETLIVAKDVHKTLGKYSNIVWMNTCIARGQKTEYIQ